LANYIAVAVGGTYFIMAINPVTGCSIVQSVKVTINQMPKLVITNPLAICEPGTIDLSAPGIASGSEPGLNYELLYRFICHNIAFRLYSCCSRGDLLYQGHQSGHRIIRCEPGCGDYQPTACTCNYES